MMKGVGVLRCVGFREMLANSFRNNTVNIVPPRGYLGVIYFHIASVV